MSWLMDGDGQGMVEIEDFLSEAVPFLKHAHILEYFSPPNYGHAIFFFPHMHQQIFFLKY